MSNIQTLLYSFISQITYTYTCTNVEYSIESSHVAIHCSLIYCRFYGMFIVNNMVQITHTKVIKMINLNRKHPVSNYKMAIQLCNELWKRIVIREFDYHVLPYYILYVMYDIYNVYTKREDVIWKVNATCTYASPTSSTFPSAND